MKKEYQEPYIGIVMLEKAPRTLIVDSQEFGDGDDVGYGDDGWHN